MQKSNRIHVMKGGNTWVYKREKTKRAIGRTDTQRESEALAKELLSREKTGGEVIIHKPNGPIRDSDTVKPAKDPNPPKDTVH